MFTNNFRTCEEAYFIGLLLVKCSVREGNEESFTLNNPNNASFRGRRQRKENTEHYRPILDNLIRLQIKKWSLAYHDVSGLP